VKKRHPGTNPRQDDLFYVSLCQNRRRVSPSANKYLPIFFFS